MKRILLLSMTSLTMLMADITLIAEQLTKANEPAITVPVNTSGIIPNSVDLIWADMHGRATGVPMGTGAMPQSMGPVFKGKLTTQFERWERSNAWFEIEEDSGKGNHCSPSINQSTNTQVELGPIYGYWLNGDTNKWEVIANGSRVYGGKTNPTNNIFGPSRGCSESTAATFAKLRNTHPDYLVEQGDVLPKFQTSFPKNYAAV